MISHKPRITFIGFKDKKKENEGKVQQEEDK